MIESPSGECRKRPQDGISREQKLVAAEKYFWCSLWSKGDIWIIIEEKLGLEVPRGGHELGGRALQACHRLVAHLASSKASRVSCGPIKMIEKFRSVCY